MSHRAPAGSGPVPRRREPVHRRIRAQQIVMAAIGLVVLGLAVLKLTEGSIGPAGAAAGFAGGSPVGLIAARINLVGWDVRGAQVVARMDRVGLVLLVALVAATPARDWLLGHWATGALLTALGLWVSAGTLAGRVLGPRRAVVGVLRAARVLPPSRRAPAR